MDNTQEYPRWIPTFNPDFLESSVFSNDSKPFRWNNRRSNAAIALALGYTEKETANMFKVTDRTIRNWKAHPEFAEDLPHRCSGEVIFSGNHPGRPSLLLV